jgi:glyoxylase-like metal-dependent hydrolase (beta-lactamase superfamily II)
VTVAAEVIKVGPLGPFANNAYIIVDSESRDAVLVDAPMESERALEAAKNLNVRRVVVTHRHGDHWANIDLVKEATEAPVYCHAADREPYAAKVDGTVADGDAITIGQTAVQVLHTPGHTPGSICLLIASDGAPVLISGDTLFPGGPGRSDSPQALRQLIESIRTRLLTLPEETLVLPGHGDDTTIGDARREYEVFASKPHRDDLCGDVTWESGD